MNILVLILLVIGAITVIALAPFALLMSGFSFDAGASPAAYAMTALFFAVPISAGWCVWQGWQQYQKAAFDMALKYALYPALLALVGVVFVVKSLVSTAIEGRRLNDESQRIDADSMHSMSMNAPKSLPNQDSESSGSVVHTPSDPQ